MNYEAALKRALALPESSERDAVIANIKAENYAREEDLDTDLSFLETRARLAAERAAKLS